MTSLIDYLIALNTPEFHKQDIYTPWNKVKGQSVASAALLNLLEPTGKYAGTKYWADNKLDRISTDLWQQQRKYPWADPQGNYTELTLPNPWKGPVIPRYINGTEVRKTFMPVKGDITADGAFYERTPQNPAPYIAIREQQNIGKTLENLNHELMHDWQSKQGYTDDKNVPYLERPLEAQARMAGYMSAIPSIWQDFITPTQIADNPIGMGFAPLGFNPLAPYYNDAVKQIPAQISTNMRQSDNNWNTLKKMSLIDALMSLK